MVTVFNEQPYDFQPTAGRSYSIGWKIFWTCFVELLVVSIVYAVLSGPVSFIQWEVDRFQWFLIPLGLFAIAYGIFVAGPIGYSVSWVYLKAVRGERIEMPGSSVFDFQLFVPKQISEDLLVAPESAIRLDPITGIAPMNFSQRDRPATTSRR